MRIEEVEWDVVDGKSECRDEYSFERRRVGERAGRVRRGRGELVRES